MAGDRYDVFSAGTRPSGVNPNAVAALAELGIDISGQRSKSIAEFDGKHFDFVVTLCDSAREICPVFHGRGERLHHSFEDPAAAPLDAQPAAFRGVRDELQRWIVNSLG